MFVTAIDWSGSREYPRHVFVLVSVGEKNIPKLSELLINKLRVKHWKKLRAREKTVYIRKFLRKWEEIKGLLSRVDIKYFFNDIISNNYDIIEKSKRLIIDDTAFKRYMGIYKGKGTLILESHAKGFDEALIQLADNISNIFRRLLGGKRDWKKEFEIMSMFKK